MLLPIYNKFNRGEIDPLAMARDDVTKIQGAHERIVNMLPMRLGPAMYRPGFMQLGSPLSVAVRMEPFVPSTDNPFQILFCSDNNIRIIKRLDNSVTAESEHLIERASGTGVSITNETFDTDLSGWTDASGVGSAATWKAGGYASLRGTGATNAKLWQTVTAGTGDNAIRFVVTKAPVSVSIGTNGVDSSDIYSGTLLPGEHSFLVDDVVDTDPFTITLSNDTPYETLIDKVEAESAGVVTLPIDLNTADFANLRVSQSADVMFCTCDGFNQFRIERRGDNSWSIVGFRANDGPFRSINDSDISLSSGALSGDTTITASGSFFRSDHVGALFKLGSLGQNVESDISAEDNGTNSIRVTGVSGARSFSIVVTGTWVATVTLQRSADDSNWEDVETYTGNQSKVYTDGLNNAELYYRLYVKAGDYTSGTTELALNYSAGSIEGIARVTGYTSDTEVDVQVLTDFGSTDATRDWYEGEWSDRRGYPTANDIYEGRLWFAGRNKLWGSVSDAYASFDRDLLGDSKSIFRTIGFGPVDFVNWLKGTNRLLMGVDSDEIEIRSSSFGEVLTNDTANLKSGSSQGAASIAPVKIDDTLMFVQNSRRKILNLQYAVDKDLHAADDLMTLNPNICIEGIKRIITLRQPETRTFALMDDGTLRVYLYDPAEQVGAWSRIESEGTIIDISVSPANGDGYNEDQLQAIIDFNGHRIISRLGMLEQVLDYHYDMCQNAVNVSSSGSLTGLTVLANQIVSVWDQSANRKIGEFTVSAGGVITDALIEQNVTYTVGMVHTGYIKTAKISRYVADQVFGRNKRICSVGIMMKDYITGTITYGDELDNLYPMPIIEGGKSIDDGTLINDYDEIPLDFDADDMTDPRVHIEVKAPCTIMALIHGIKNPQNPYGTEE